MKRLTKALIGAVLGTVALGSVVTLTACEHKHDWATDYTVDTPATCTTDGSKSIHCSGCDEVKDVTPIPAGHSWADDYTVDTPATCTTDGSKSIHCDNCDETKDVTVITAGHAWDNDFTVDTPAACAQDGSKSIHCANCDETKDVTSLPATGHDWNEWVITSMPTTEENGTGIATKTCKVDGCGGQIQVILPVLTDEAYVKGDDSATCSSAGEQSYTYTDSDNNTVTFNVETPKKTVTLTTVSANTSGKGATIALPSGSPLNLGNWKYFECPDCHKLFSMDTALTSDEARHVAENEIDFATKTSSMVNSAYYNGPAVLGDNKVYFSSTGSSSKGGILFKSEEDGVYKISAEDVNGLFGIIYYGKTEKSTTPATVYNTSGFQKGANNFERFTYTNPSTTNCVYVKMDEGDVVGVAFKDFGHKVVNFNVEKVTDVSALNCYTHVEAYDVSSFNVGGGIIKNKCVACGAEIDDADYNSHLVYSKGVVVNEANESSPTALINDTMVVKTGVAEGTYYSFTPDTAKDYEIIFNTLFAANKLTLKGIKCGDEVAASYDTALTIDSAYSNIIKVTGDGTGISVIIKVGAANVGKAFTFNFDVTGASADNPAYLTSAVNSTVPQFIVAGDNTVSITEEFAPSGKYFFVSDVDGRYSLTVPAGVEVIMNDGDFIKGDSTVANFNAPAGVRIGFEFRISNGTTGDITVTVGEPVAISYPTVTTDASASVTFNAKSGSAGSYTGGVAFIQVGAIEAGTYKMTVTIPQNLCNGAYIAFGKNKEGTAYNSFYDNTDNIRLDEDSAAEAYVYTGNFQTKTVNGADYTLNYVRAKWTITLDLQEGDILVFANGGLTGGELTVSLEKV